MLSNLAETLHSSAKLENRQVAKIWSLYLKKQRFGATIIFPEGLEDTLFIIDKFHLETKDNILSLIHL